MYFLVYKDGWKVLKNFWWPQIEFIVLTFNKRNLEKKISTTRSISCIPLNIDMPNIAHDLDAMVQGILTMSTFYWFFFSLFFSVEIFLVSWNYISIYVERLFVNVNCNASIHILEYRIIPIYI